jgi:uncharacterized OB-fold protein
MPMHNKEIRSTSSRTSEGKRCGSIFSTPQSVCVQENKKPTKWLSLSLSNTLEGGSQKKTL